MCNSNLATLEKNSFNTRLAHYYFAKYMNLSGTILSKHVDSVRDNERKIMKILVWDQAKCPCVRNCESSL